MESLITLTVAVVLGVVWGVRQEGRITTLSQRVHDHDDSHSERVDSLKELINARFDAQSARLDRIERGMNGHQRGGGYGRV